MPQPSAKRDDLEGDHRLDRDRQLASGTPTVPTAGKAQLRSHPACSGGCSHSGGLGGPGVDRSSSGRTNQ
jgi:hypothetical protein